MGSSTLYTVHVRTAGEDVSTLQPACLPKGIYASVSISSVAFGSIAVGITRDFQEPPKVMVQESEMEWSQRDCENEAWEWELGYITSYLCLLVSFLLPLARR